MRGTLTWIPFIDYSPYARGRARAIDAICDPTIGLSLTLCGYLMYIQVLLYSLSFEYDHYEWKQPSPRAKSQSSDGHDLKIFLGKNSLPRGVIRLEGVIACVWFIHFVGFTLTLFIHFVLFLSHAYIHTSRGHLIIY